MNQKTVINGFDGSIAIKMFSILDAIFGEQCLSNSRHSYKSSKNCGNRDHILIKAI